MSRYMLIWLAVALAAAIALALYAYPIALFAMEEELDMNLREHAVSRAATGAAIDGVLCGAVVFGAAMLTRAAWTVLRRRQR